MTPTGIYRCDGLWCDLCTETVIAFDNSCEPTIDVDIRELESRAVPRRRATYDRRGETAGRGRRREVIGRRLADYVAAAH